MKLRRSSAASGISNVVPGTLPALVAAMSTACVQPPPDPAAGAEHLEPFKAALQQALRRGMAEGPVSAIQVCRVQAPAIASSVTTKAVRLGRASHRLRNPANSAAKSLWRFE